MNISKRATPHLMQMVLLAAVLLLPVTVSAGLFVGGQLDDSGYDNWYLGVQSEGQLHAMAVTGRNPHFIDGLYYRENYMAAALGYRWYGDWTVNLLAGMENSRLFLDGQPPPAFSYSGPYAQLQLMKFYAVGHMEYLTSYGVDSEHLWARARIVFYAPADLLIGPELFAERFGKSRIDALGVVLQKAISDNNVSLQLGLKRQNENDLFYTGLELFHPF